MLAIVSPRRLFLQRKLTPSFTVIGVQHHKLGEILISIFDPKIPRVGGSRSIAVRAMEVSWHSIRSCDHVDGHLQFPEAYQEKSERTMRDRIIQPLDPTWNLHSINGDCHM